MNERPRFLVIEHGDYEEGSTPHLCTEERVSRRIDMSDCYDGPFEVWYITDEGKIVKVEYGKERRINTDEEMPFRYASTPMVADGATVGHVIHTDH